jgi:hypothetical protein
MLMSRVRQLALAMAFATVASTTVVATAAAYSGSAAATYSDTWATARNSAFPTVGYTDCTNFVSQALHAGGFSYHQSDLLPSGTIDRYSVKNWYVRRLSNGALDWAYSFTVVKDSLDFLYFDYPGGFANGLALGTATQTTATANSVGDVFYYDWGQGPGLSHESIKVAHGTDPDPTHGHWIGDLIDAHDSDHFHAYWSLRPYNADLMNSTHIILVHIDVNNN